MSPQTAANDILYLPQFVNLFSGSIIENLRILSGGAPVARLLQAAELTGLSSFVESLPMSFETVLAPGGKNISGGQRQLIALTAAIASERKLLLLDEALSNLDPIPRPFHPQGPGRPPRDDHRGAPRGVTAR